MGEVIYYMDKLRELDNLLMTLKIEGKPIPVSINKKLNVLSLWYENEERQNDEKLAWSIELDLET